MTDQEVWLQAYCATLAHYGSVDLGTCDKAIEDFKARFPTPVVVAPPSPLVPDTAVVPTVGDDLVVDRQAFYDYARDKTPSIPAERNFLIDEIEKLAARTKKAETKLAQVQTELGVVCAAGQDYLERAEKAESELADSKPNASDFDLNGLLSRAQKSANIYVERDLWSTAIRKIVDRAQKAESEVAALKGKIEEIGADGCNTNVEAEMLRISLADVSKQLEVANARAQKAEAEMVLVKNTCDAFARGADARTIKAEKELAKVRSFFFQKTHASGPISDIKDVKLGDKIEVFLTDGGNISRNRTNRTMSATVRAVPKPGTQGSWAGHIGWMKGHLHPGDAVVAEPATNSACWSIDPAHMDYSHTFTIPAGEFECIIHPREETQPPAVEEEVVSPAEEKPEAKSTASVLFGMAAGALIGAGMAAIGEASKTGVRVEESNVVEAVIEEASKEMTA